MHSVTFGYAGKPFPNFQAVQQAAYLVKSDPTPVGVELCRNPFVPNSDSYRVVTYQEYQQAARANSLVWTAVG